MEENLENYNRLIGRLRSGDRSTFRNDLEMLARTFGSFRPLEHLAQLSFQNKELLGVILELIKEHGQGGNLGALLFHAVRRIGPQAIPYIREEWERNIDAKGVHYLHMCVMDIIGASSNEEESRRLMPIIAEQEIPFWIAMMQRSKTSSRGWLGSAAGALAKYAPSRARQAGDAIISLLYDDVSSVRTHAVRGLLSIGSKTMLQDALFCLARVDPDGSALELLLSVSGSVDVNAVDETGKTALTYARELGNERTAEMLKNAGANEMF